ncbi:MAG: tetratricopeptide repeat protein, partial [Anaerolineales bacterium]|nr:tetratricopeptide repeat protein [Anaerolineales bacterium]
VLAYRLLAGTHPFDIYAEDTIGEILDGEPDWSKVDASVQVVIRTLLAKKPEKRYQTAVATSTALAYAIGLPEPAETAVIRESYLQAATFVGRQTEMTQLTTALTQTKAGESSVWLIGGESGVGKSRLLDELRAHALVAGWQVLRGQAIAEGGVPYHLWRLIALRLALGTELSDLEAGVLQEISPSLPHLLGREIAQVPELSGKAGEERLVLTIISILQKQTQPTLLILEDLQWAGESLTPVKQILKTLSQLPRIMVIGTYRRDECPDLPNDLPGAQGLLLERLNEQEIAQLSQAMLGQAASTSQVISLLSQETEGNTFFIIEVMRALAEEAGKLANIGEMTLPEGVITSGMNALLLRRLQKIPAADKPLLQLAAVAGREIDERLLHLLAPDVATDKWLLRGAEAAVLNVRDNRWQFSHDKLRETLLSQLTGKQNQAYHRQVALALETLYAEHTHYHAILLAHWQAAGEEEKELYYLERVAQQAIQIAADYEQGQILLNRGLKLLSPQDRRRGVLLNYLALAYVHQGMLDEAEGIAQQAYNLAQTVNDQASLAHSLNIMGMIARDHSEYEAALGYLQQSLAIQQAIEDQPGIAETLYIMGIIARYQGAYETVLTYCQQGLAICQAIGNQQGIARGFNSMGLVAYQQGAYVTARDYFQQSLTIRRAIGDQQGLATSLNNLGLVADQQGDYLAGHDYFQQSFIISQNIGDQLGVALCLNNLGENAIDRGAYEVALTLIKQSLAMQQAIGDQEGIAISFNSLGAVAHEQGAYETAQAYYQQALALWESLSSKNYLHYAILGLGSLHFEQGQLRQALAKLYEAHQYQLSIKNFENLNRICGYIGLSQVAAGGYAEALTTALDHFQMWQALNLKQADGLVHVAVAQVLAAREAGQLGTANLAETIGILTDLTQLVARPAAYFEAALVLAKSYFIRLRVMIEYGRYLAQSGQDEKARMRLNEAKAMAEASQLAYKVSEIEALLGSIGQTAVFPTLTPSKEPHD